MTNEAPNDRPQKSNGSRIAAATVLLVFLCLLFFLLVLLNGSIVEPVPVGSPVPSVASSLRMLSDSDHAVPERRKTIVIFVSPTCEHCLFTVSSLQHLHGRFHPYVILISNGTSQQTTPLAADSPLHIYHDVDGVMKERYRVNIVPTTLFIDENNMLVYRRSGRKDFAKDSMEVVQFLTSAIGTQ